MEFDTILYRVERGRARITLNRPEKLNALSSLLQRELSRALWEADNDIEVHSVILRGAGRAFSAGYDMVEVVTAEGSTTHRAGETIEDAIWALEQEQYLRMAIWDMHKPVLCGIHGYCLAGGTDLALLSDIIVAAEDCIIGFPPVRDQGTPSAHMWTYLVGPQWAKRMLLTGDSITGADAARIGLVYKAVPYDAIDEELDSLADKMSHIGIEVLAANKRAVNTALELMGARTMQRLAAELDARAVHGPSDRAFYEAVAEKGLKAAVAERDAKFGDGRASVEYQRRRELQQERLKRD